MEMLKDNKNLKIPMFKMSTQRTTTTNQVFSAKDFNAIKTRILKKIKMTQTCQQCASQTQIHHDYIQSINSSSFCNSATTTTRPNLSVNIANVLVFITVLLSYSNFTDARATTQTFPIAAPLLGNLATSGSLLNSTMTLLSTQQKLSIETNSIQRPYVGSNTLGTDHGRALKRAFLSNNSITCNDNSKAGFYLRKNPSSKKWIVFLEGGWHCFDTKSCRTRWLKLRHLMTSSQWPETREVGGILSPLHEENPYWHKANHVLVPYCSSDSWSGTRATAESSGENNWRFMGSLILRQVITDLIPLGLGRVAGAELLLVGSSAGGLGVMLNLDRITHYLQNERNLPVTVRGVSDSGWFLDREPYTPSAVASSEAVRQGWKLWGGQVPEECAKQHAAEPWRCYFGYRLYPTLKSPLFIFQWLFDEAQMKADNVGAPVTPQQWNYIHEMGGALRSSLDNVTAVFAPSCIGHAVLSKRDWVNIKIDDISLPTALRCWEHSTRLRRKRHNKLKRSTESSVTNAPGENQAKNRPRNNNQRNHRHREANKRKNKPNNSNSHTKINHNPNRVRLTKEQREERRKRRHEKRQRRLEKQRKRRRHHKTNERNLTVAGAENDVAPQTATTERRNNNRRNRKNNGSADRKHGHHEKQLPQLTPENANGDLQYQKDKPADQPKKLQSNNSHATNRHSNRAHNVPENCALRLLERCSWPQCNHSCPNLTNPLTGEEMRFLELLTSFGLDIEAVAAALGVDMHTLDNMDRTELVNLLTQQVS